jgi:Cu/Ag efflux protein CusF
MKTLLAAMSALSLAAAAAPALAQTAASAPAAAVQTTQTEATVTAVDAKAGRVTLHHGRIPALGWPAMTMPFKAEPAAVLNGVKVGQKVRVTLQVRGSDDPVITAVETR